MSKTAKKIALTQPAEAKARKRFRFHPLADLLPLLEGDELHRLSDDIRENGLLEPILLTPDGRILEG